MGGLKGSRRRRMPTSQRGPTALRWSEERAKLSSKLAPGKLEAVQQQVGAEAEGTHLSIVFFTRARLVRSEPPLLLLGRHEPARLDAEFVFFLFFSTLGGSPVLHVARRP